MLTSTSYRQHLARTATSAEFFAGLCWMGELAGGGWALHAWPEVNYFLHTAADGWSRIKNLDAGIKHCSRQMMGHIRRGRRRGRALTGLLGLRWRKLVCRRHL